MITISTINSFRICDQSTLTQETNLIEFLNLDSMGIFEFIVFLEEETGVELFNNNIDIDNIKSIDAINSFIDNIGK
jgi:acyl carrier protein